VVDVVTDVKRLFRSAVEQPYISFGDDETLQYGAAAGFYAVTANAMVDLETAGLDAGS
jgi:hypothetical protein